MGWFGSNKKGREPTIAAEDTERPPPVNPFPQDTRQYPTTRHDGDTGFVPVSYRAPNRDAPTDQLVAAQQRIAQRDAEILEVIFAAFGRSLPQWGTHMKKYEKIVTSDYEFNEGNFDKRYKDFERLIADYMEERGWKVKEFSIRNSKVKSKSTLTKYYPEVRWHVLEPGTFKAKR
ncbi:hypothetical protein PYCC9005_001907 [Savitreella phatthalungensis]